MQRIGGNQGEEEAKLAEGKINSRVALMNERDKNKWQEALAQFQDRLQNCLNFNNNPNFFGLV